MGNVAASLLVLSLVVWMAWLGARPASLIHATAAAPRLQTRPAGASPFVQVYGEKLAIGSVYWLARAQTGPAPPVIANEAGRAG